MSIILNIDSSIETASVSIAKDAIILAHQINKIQKEHATFLHYAVKQLLEITSKTFSDIDAIAVAVGPGSYTGLRVGMASAKGFCYALNKPLITIGTLDALTTAAMEDCKNEKSRDSLFCPMIDARRQEVYTALFDQNMQEILAPCAMVLDEHSFFDYLLHNNICFFGSGADKWSRLTRSENALFLKENDITNAISQISHKKYIKSDFTNLPYAEPLYVKEFFSP